MKWNVNLLLVLSICLTLTSCTSRTTDPNTKTTDKALAESGSGNGVGYGGGPISFTTMLARTQKKFLPNIAVVEIPPTGMTFFKSTSGGLFFTALPAAFGVHNDVPATTNDGIAVTLRIVVGDPNGDTLIDRGDFPLFRSCVGLTSTTECLVEEYVNGVCPESFYIHRTFCTSYGAFDFNGNGWTDLKDFLTFRSLVCGGDPNCLEI